MINNRQGGRRRGRGGQRPQGISGRPDGNRQDNRQRGNAAQLLEKYKALARDMQLAGDRVQTEYYLQFADHYFRVLEDGRSRFEEQNQRRPRDDDDRDGDDESAAADNASNDDDDGEEQRPAPRRDRQRQDSEPRGERPQRAERPDRQDGDARPERPQRERPERNERQDGDTRTDRPQRIERQDGDTRTDRPQRADRAERNDRPARPRREPAPAVAGEERIALGVLPPAIGVGPDDGAGEPAAPRRRVRKPRAEDNNEETAPVA